METHHIKICPESYEAIISERKLFIVVRENDINCKEGDVLIMEEYQEFTGYSSIKYTGRSVAVKVGYVLRNHPGLLPGWIVMSIFKEGGK